MRRKETEHVKIPYEQWIKDNPTLKPRELADLIFGDIDQATRDRCARIHIRGQIVARRKISTRRVETRARRKGLLAEFPADSARGAKAMQEARRAQEVIRITTAQYYAVRVRSLRMYLDEEFLRSKFAIGDGREVEWGKGKLADHDKFISLESAKHNSHGDTIAMHIAAREKMVELGADDMDEVKAKGVEVVDLSEAQAVA